MPPCTVRNKLKHENRILLLTLLSGIPAVIMAMVFLWNGQSPTVTKWTLTLLACGAWFGLAFAVRERVVRPLQTISNLLAALREEDYSIRARGAGRGDALGEFMFEVNALSETLRKQRLGALETTTLLRAVMEEIDVAVFAFDDGQRLRLVNRAGERLVSKPAERLLGRTAGELGLDDCLQGEPTRMLSRTFPGGIGRWGMRRTTFRQDGLPHQLVVLADLSKALREEERQAWQRLLRVLGHELNNSLAPIKSISNSLGTLVTKDDPPDDWKDDMQRGLGVIASRADALSRFMESYSRLARLPPPRLQPMKVEPWIRRVVNLEMRVKLDVHPGPELMIEADSDQLEQLLINLLRNAVDAVMELEPGANAAAGQSAQSMSGAPNNSRSGVSVRWSKSAGNLEVCVEDDGPGLSNTSNLFVPFFTTKPGGSGIGLVLCRQIAEGHGGSLTLENRQTGHGCLARLRLPIGETVVREATSRATAPVVEREPHDTGNGPGYGPTS